MNVTAVIRDGSFSNQGKGGIEAPDSPSNAPTCTGGQSHRFTASEAVTVKN